LEEVALADVIVHVASGWRSSSSIRGDVRSTCCIRPRTGKRTSATSMAKTALAMDMRSTPATPFESPNGSGAGNTAEIDTWK
jgi:hypothetical protein